MAQTERLLVGVSKVDITPENPVALTGYSSPEERISEGIHDRLYARALAFRAGAGRCVLLSADLAGFQTVPILHYQKEIFARLRLKPEELFLCGTHTHSGPMLFLSRTYPHPNNYEYSQWLKGRLFGAVEQALARLAPARVGVATGECAVAVNRRLPLPPSQIKPGGDRVTMARNPEGEVDRQVQVLRIERSGAAPAALFDYGCHSRSLRAANHLISGDIFGIAEQYAERTLGGGAVSPAFAGASGDIDPWDVVDGFGDESSRVSETVRQGTSLGEEVVRLFRTIAATAAPSALRARSRNLSVPGRSPANPKSVLIQAASLGTGIAFLGLDCEALVAIGKAIKRASPFRHTLILTHCNGGSGYLPPADLYPDRGYEVNISGFAPQAADLVVQAAIEMLQQLKTGLTG
jgi:neutral ceramidase